MSQKKVVGRNVAIALGIICIVFVAALAAAVVQYTSVVNERDETIATKDSDYQSYVSTHSYSDTQYGSLQSQYNDYVATHHYTDSQYNSLQSQYDSLYSNYNIYVYNHTHTNAEYDNLNQIVTLIKSMDWVDSQTVSQPQNSYTGWSFYANYAGYIVVTVESSTTTLTYVEVIYTAHGVSYDNRVAIGASGTPAFPVLPSWVQIRVGNTNWSNGATETVTITYWY
jgi:hypothetical protein